ncbi:MAG: hypothetical protein FJ031_10705 [Chloroflexi bacterium]|nr:hypothetical protein [Chloroflexota bacterium]
MFKRLFLLGLAFMLALGGAFQALPAFALTPVSAVINNVSWATVSSTGIRQAQVGFTLSSCYAPSISSPQLVSGSGTTAPYISVFIKGIPAGGQVCQPRMYTTLVSIDTNKFNLAPGTYDVLFNPVNGQSKFKLSFTILPKFEYENALILKAVQLADYPPNFQISGTLSSPCYKLDAPAITMSGNVITVRITGSEPTGAICAGVVSPFTTSVVIDPVSLHLDSGEYMILINPVNGQSNLTFAMTVP